MRPRFNTSQINYSRYSSTRHTSQLQPRQAIRFDRPSSSPLQTPAENEISTAELNNFALSCIERLAFPDHTNTDKPLSVEDTIAASVIDTLPSYTTLKATLVACLQENSDGHAWSSPLQTEINLLRNRVDVMQETISQHLIQTGEEIGLPTPLLTKLADITRTVLSRYAE